VAIAEFPPISNCNEDGLLAIGGDLEIPSLLLAYKNGIFPWPYNEEYPLCWFSPDPRGVIKYKNLHISKSLKKIIKQRKFDIKYNHNFEAVIHGCANAKNRNDRGETWITQQMIQAYIDLFYAGFAFSVEAYQNEKLVGGVYGVRIGTIVSGESMFYTVSNASKVCLIFLIEKLHSDGIDLLDTQMVTPVTKQLGAIEISRKEFFKYHNIK
jgi:leucyl/phenylalanyl-tRNA--protein transferase